MEGAGVLEFYRGCTIVITGASSGLGAEFARQLGPQAGTLILVARRLDRLEELRAQLASAHPELNILIRQVDLGREDQRKAFADWVLESAPPVDVLINNAGLGDHGEFSDSDWERVRAMLDVNIAALTHLTRLLLPALTATGRGTILNVSSVAGFFPLPNMAVYSATKAYVTSFSEALAMELRPRRIRVTALCPGPIPTEFFEVAERRAGRQPHHHTMPAFVVTPAEAVRAGLKAAAASRPRVIPGPLLAVAVCAALLVPFGMVRFILRNLAPRL